MSSYDISFPKPTMIRVQFPNGWNAEVESGKMFQELLRVLDEAKMPVTLVVVAGKARPVYSSGGLVAAQNILMHENIRKMLVIADNPKPAVTHMAGLRGERGLPAIPIIGFTNETEALQQE